MADNTILPPNVDKHDEAGDPAGARIDGSTATAVLDSPNAEPLTRQGKQDKELELYRSLMEPAKEFKDGFTWTAIAGAIFCGLLMMPGSIFMSLITGGTINAAWVTLIIFSEISRRALKTLNKQELVVLLYVANAMVLGGPIADLIFRQYFIQSNAIRDIGLLGQFPSWYAPQPGSAAILERNLFDPAWLIPIAIVFFVMIMGKIASYTLGYFFFRMTSDVEKLPFPFAPIQAQGVMALAESGERKMTWKWRIFSVGAILGLAFGAVQIGIPLITQALMGNPIRLIPLPWYDSTTLTQGFLPATPTGIVVDLGLVLTGMVIPRWAIVGQAAAIILTMFLNPMLHKMHLLTRWQPGMETVATTFANRVDFWMSFILGVAAAIALISIYQTSRAVMDAVKKNRQQRAEGISAIARKENMWGNIPKGRGDFSPWVALAVYGVSSLMVVWLCYILVPGFPIFFLLFFTLFYTPLITFINARLIGICGQHVEIPFIREGAYILSGYHGVNIWLAPIPIDNHGDRVQSFRVNELTGTRFWSYVKADALIIPLSFTLSLVFWAFIWKASAIPSDAFPYVHKMWELMANERVLLYSATLPTTGAKPLFYQALHPTVIAGGFSFTTISFLLLSYFGVPIMAIYGFLQAVGGMPHAFVPQIIGALISRFYLQKKMGQRRVLEIAPVLVAGYFTGAGLIALIGVGVLLIKNAISPAPF